MRALTHGEIFKRVCVCCVVYTIIFGTASLVVGFLLIFAPTSVWRTTWITNLLTFGRDVSFLAAFVVVAAVALLVCAILCGIRQVCEWRFAFVIFGQIIFICLALPCWKNIVFSSSHFGWFCDVRFWVCLLFGHLISFCCQNYGSLCIIGCVFCANEFWTFFSFSSRVCGCLHATSLSSSRYLDSGGNDFDVSFWRRNCPVSWRFADMTWEILKKSADLISG